MSRPAPTPTRQRHPDPLESPLLLSVPNAAALIGVSGRYLWDLVRAGEIPNVRLGRRVLLRREDINTFIASRTTSGTASSVRLVAAS